MVLSVFGSITTVPTMLGAICTGETTPVTATNIVSIIDDADDGRITVYENGGTAHVIDGNSTTVFNENSTNKDFRVESDGNTGMLFVDASTNRVGVGTTGPAQTLHVQGSARISGLGGSGTRMVVANANGDLSTQAIGGGGSDNDWTVSGSNVYNSTANVAVGTNNPNGNRMVVSSSNSNHDW